jgi:hypothetical protein
MAKFYIATTEDKIKIINVNQISDATYSNPGKDNSTAKMEVVLIAGRLFTFQGKDAAYLMAYLRENMVTETDLGLEPGQTP